MIEYPHDSPPQQLLRGMRGTMSAMLSEGQMNHPSDIASATRDLAGSAELLKNQGNLAQVGTEIVRLTASPHQPDRRIGVGLLAVFIDQAQESERPDLVKNLGIEVYRKEKRLHAYFPLQQGK